MKILFLIATILISVTWGIISYNQAKKGNYFNHNMWFMVNLILAMLLLGKLVDYLLDKL